jgi:hypothetical protein
MRLYLKNHLNGNLITHRSIKLTHDQFLGGASDTLSSVVLLVGVRLRVSVPQAVEPPGAV